MSSRPRGSAISQSGDRQQRAAALLQQRREDDQGEEPVGHGRNGRQDLDDGLDHLAQAKGRTSLRQMAAAMPSGTATRMAPSVTRPLPKKMARAPNSGGWPLGYQAVLVKNSPMPRSLKKGSASRVM